VTKNPVKLIRHPNSPQAIQNRLDGYGNLQPYEKLHLIDDIKAGSIFIDLTEENVSQRINYTITGGSKHLNKKLVRSSLFTDTQGRLILTSYYVDTTNQQWITIKSFFTRPLPANETGSFGGYFSSARGENWRNEGRSVDEIQRIQHRLFTTPKLDPTANLDKDHPEDRFHDDFTGQY